MTYTRCLKDQQHAGEPNFQLADEGSASARLAMGLAWTDQRVNPSASQGMTLKSWAMGCGVVY